MSKFFLHLSLNMPSTSLSSETLPLCTNFDFVAYMTHLVDIAPLPNMDLQEKNQRNILIEKTNNMSMGLTCAYQAVLAMAAGVGTLDVSAPLLPCYAYTDEDKMLLVVSKDLVEAMGPLPVYMMVFVTKEHVKTASVELADKTKHDKEHADKDAEKLNPQSQFLVVEFPHSIPKELVRRAQTSVIVMPDKFQIVDVAKVSKMFLHKEDGCTSLTLSLWCQASQNLLTALVKLCPKIDPNDPSSPMHTYTSEYNLHVVFFTNIDIFDVLMHIWCPVECKLCLTIFSDSFFDQKVYEQKLDTAMSTYEQIKELGLHHLLSAPLPSSTTGVKCRPANNANPALLKQQKSGRRNESCSQGSAPCEGSSPRDCLPDGAALFSKPNGNGGLCTTSPFHGNQPKTPCILFNVGSVARNGSTSAHSARVTMLHSLTMEPASTCKTGLS
ncbi:hypothetical protein B0H10DRAFT_2336555 [Mycena sp. CBHHK59/15]|nr:hypothetical protein B0H10DRAFT_2336555 [Mycena sp. CBHHK59/15]